MEINFENELELKILEVNRDKIYKRLNNLGASFISKADLQSYYFDYSNGKLRENGMSIRIRKLSGEFSSQGFKKLYIKTEISLKKKLLGDDPKNYFEMTNDLEGDCINELIKKLPSGFRETDAEYKYRESYVLEGARFEIEDIYYTKILGYKNIPTFVEVQSVAEDITRNAVALLGYEHNK